jgi:exopolysaccharide biosynthesis polyprenyl glycosylphosphotransferase
MTVGRMSIRPETAARINLAADFAILVLAAGWSYDFQSNGAELLRAVTCASIAVGVWFITASALRHYDAFAYNRATTDDASLVAVLACAATTVLALSNLILKPNGLVLHVRLCLAVALPSALALRLLLRSIVETEGHVDEVLIVGVGPIGRLTGQDLGKRGRRHRVVGYLEYGSEGEQDLALLIREAHPSEVRLLGRCADLESILRKMPVSEVYIAGNVRKHDAEMQSCIKVCERLGVPFALPASGFRLERARPMDSHDVADGYLHYLAVDGRPHQMALKRLIDIASSAFALWLLMPLFLIVGLLIKLTSRGPVLFKQVRSGLHARPFHMLKFRSMVADAEEWRTKLSALNEQQGPVFKMKSDPRVTAVGRFIRKYSIDELPQLINVLRGDMSLVGPRPPLPDELAKYEAWQLRRLSVRPGLTCIWQVSGRSQISFDQWMYLDLQYIDHWSLAQDFSLLFKTLPAVITGRGAS